MSNVAPHAVAHTIDLDHEQLLILDDQPGSRVQVLFGGVWLTEENSLEDRFAGSGQWLTLEAGGRAIAESRGPTRLRVFEPARAGWRRWRRLADRVLPFGRAACALLALSIGVGLPDLLAREMHRAAYRHADQELTVANWSSPMLGTSDGRPTISGSTDPIAVRSLRV